jgi:hypothetical protein
MHNAAPMAVPITPSHTGKPMRVAKIARRIPMPPVSLRGISHSWSLASPAKGKQAKLRHHRPLRAS